MQRTVFTETIICIDSKSMLSIIDITNYHFKRCICIVMLYNPVIIPVHMCGMAYSLTDQSQISFCLNPYAIISSTSIPRKFRIAFPTTWSHYRIALSLFISIKGSKSPACSCQFLILSDFMCFKCSNHSPTSCLIIQYNTFIITFMLVKYNDISTPHIISYLI